MNAVEAMEADGVLTVRTEHRGVEKAIYLYVQDNGKGISEEDMAHIFEPFFTTKSAVKGVGLGLSVVYGIVQNHNADINVKSKIQEGTTFIIKFPLGKPKAEKA